MAGKKGRSGRPKTPTSPKDILKKLLPINELFNEDELAIYNNLLEVYMYDFDDDDLSANDMDDIMNLAINRVMEFRLLKGSKDNITNHLDTSSAIEKIRKHSNSIKENLSTRRKDRVDPNKYDDFTIVDLAVAFDDEKKKTLRENEGKLLAEEKAFLEKRKSYAGNKDDKDRFVKDDDSSKSSGDN